MKIERIKIISSLRSYETIIENPVVNLSEEEREAWKIALNEKIKSTMYARYRVTLLGAFSSGKTTVLNAFLGRDVLPTEDLPTTAAITEIYASERSHLFIPLEHKEVHYDLKQEFEDALSARFPSEKIDIITTINRDGIEFSGIGVRLSQSVEVLHYLLSELAAQKNRKNQVLPYTKQLLNEDTKIPIWLGISDCREEWRDVVLTDAPGVGSVSEAHEMIVNHIMQKSHLVLYLLDSTKVGSAIDPELSDRISNCTCRKVFYLLNKIDRLDEDSRMSCEDLARRTVPPVDTQKGVAPDFIQISGLLANWGQALKQGRVQVQEICRDRKSNLMPILADVAEISEWSHPSEEMTEKVAQRLLDESNFSFLQNRIGHYLEHENKEMAVADDALGFIKALTDHLRRVCGLKITTLRKKKSKRELMEEHEEQEKKRRNIEQEIMARLDSLLMDCKDPVRGYPHVIHTQLEDLCRKMSETFAKQMKNDSLYKKWKEGAPNDRKEWVSSRISARHKILLETVKRDFDIRWKHFIDETRSFLASELSPEGYNWNSEVTQPVYNPIDGGFSPLTATIGVEALAALAWGSTVVSTPGIVFGTASGLSSVLSSMGLGAASGIVFASGSTATAATCVFNPALIWAWPYAAFSIFGLLTYFGLKRYNRAQLPKKMEKRLNEMLLTGYVDDDGNSHDALVDTTEKQVLNDIDAFITMVKDKVHTQLEYMAQREESNLKDLLQEHQEREKMIQSAMDFQKTLDKMLEDAQKSLKSF